MKKILFTVLIALLSYNASAQFFAGLAFDINWTNDGYVTNSGVDKKVDNSWGGSVSPQFGYQFNKKFQVGTRLNFLFEKTYYMDQPSYQEKPTNYVIGSIGWDIAPFCRYKIAEFGRNGWFSIWADLHAYFGRMYPTKVQEDGYITQNFNRKYIYGIQGMPAVGFRINEHSTLFINVALLSLAYSGSYTEFEDRAAYSNKLLLFTGKISGTINAMTSEGMYGIKFGMVRTF